MCRFDNFYAVPYGPVESDVYNYIRQCEMRAMIGIFVLLKFLEE